MEQHAPRERLLSTPSARTRGGHDWPSSLRDPASTLRLFRRDMHCVALEFADDQVGSLGRCVMAKTFRVGNHVSWNSEAGRVRGRIVRVHTKDVTYKGYVHHASPEDPQYEIKSDKTDHVALHKGRALRRLGG